MNRLILIGNGFDIAHRIETSYKDFILDYLKNAFNTANADLHYKDDFLTLTKNGYFKKQVNRIQDIDSWEIKNFCGYIENDNSLGISVSGMPIEKDTFEYSLKIKSNLISELLKSCKEYNWVDIENEYYKMLCGLSTKNKEKEIAELNNDFQVLQNLLYEYLIKIEEQYIANQHNVSKSELVTQLTEPIEHNQAPKTKLSYRISTNDGITKSNTRRPEKKPKPDKILFLNFNYTSTIESYAKEIRKTTPNTEIIYIHGKLKDANNPMVFGYGDEEETNFEVLEKYDECLKYVKTYWYLRTHNYEKLLSFIDFDEYEVYIMGHSCGMSDKTMLSSIFNHANCKKIKILTYDKSFGTKDLAIETTNYIEMTYQIGRLFKNKDELRKKIIPFETRDLLKVNKDKLMLDDL